MTLAWEVAANALNAVSILLAGRNNVHTWWIGILGCLAFGYLFFSTQLYADATLQVFFVGSSAVGWWRWTGGVRKPDLPVRHTRVAHVVLFGAAGVAVAAGYGLLLRTWTDAYAPFADSMVLAFSVLGQLLLIERRVESWWCWLRQSGSLRTPCPSLPHDQPSRRLDAPPTSSRLDCDRGAFAPTPDPIEQGGAFALPLYPIDQPSRRIGCATTP